MKIILGAKALQRDFTVHILTNTALEETAKLTFVTECIFGHKLLPTEKLTEP